MKIEIPNNKRVNSTDLISEIRRQYPEIVSIKYLPAINRTVLDRGGRETVVSDMATLELSDEVSRQSVMSIINAHNPEFTDKEAADIDRVVTMKDLKNILKDYTKKQNG